jgi:hypothetical protein
MIMRATATLLSLIAGLWAASSVEAGELTPMAGLSIKLGDVSGSAYYTVEKDGFRVVATVAAGDNTTPVRVVTTLLSGQKVNLSVPRAVDQSALAVEIERIADRVFVHGGEKVIDLVQ